MTNRAYAVLGRAPAQAAEPETMEQAQAIVRAASGLSLVPWGGGTRQCLGFPLERYDLALSTAKLTRITEYVPADLTVTAEAGLTVAQLQEVLAEQGQTLPLEVALPSQQTLGGVIAARADSLTRFSRGSVRDCLLGITVINCRGEVVKGGGKVVKNVAGYDLPKLYCGSLGTLGLITEATFKVAPLPESSATALLPLSADFNSEDVLDTLLGSDLMPTFLFLLNPEAARAVVPGAEPVQYVIAGFDGNAEAVAWQLKTLGADALDPTTALEVRSRLRDFSLDAAPMTAAFHLLSSQVGAFSRMVEWTARRAGFTASVVSDAALGLMTAHFVPTLDEASWASFYVDLKDKADRCGGSFRIERMPAALRESSTPVWSPLLPDFRLMARVKEILDPERMWNPGRFLGQL